MKKRRNRWIACCLFLSLLISLFPLSAFAQQSTADITTSETEPASPGFSEPDSIEEIQPTLSQTATEIPSRRERNVKHFDFGNGIYQAISYGSPVHRMDANGNWQDIDNRLLPDADNALQYATADGRIRVAKQSPMLILNENGYRIGMQPTSTVAIRMQNAEIQNHDELPQSLTRNATELGRVSNTTTVRYRDLYPSVDLEYILDGDDIKENIIVNAPTDRYTYLFDLALEGLVPELTDGGEILLRDAKTDDEMYRIPAPYMYDAGGNTSQAVHYELAGQDGMYQLLVTADANWINAKDRAFPVTIDPTIVQRSLWNTHIASVTPNGNYGTETALWISGAEISFIRSSHVTFPFGSSITSATLNVYYYYADHISGGGVTAGAYQVMHSWKEYGDGGLTWNIANPNSNSYINATCLSTAYLSGARSAYQSSPKVVSFNITKAARTWRSDPSSNYGIALRYQSGPNSSVALWSYEAGSTYRSYFSFYYTIATEQQYLFKSGCYPKKYVQIDDNAAPNFNGENDIIEQWSLDGGGYQKWTFTHISDNYFTIKSTVNGKLITVPAGKETSSSVSLVLKPQGSTISDTQLWRITQTSNGLYKIKAKSAESYTDKDLVMRVNTKGLHSEDGLNIMQMPYTDDDQFQDEWWIGYIRFWSGTPLEGQQKSNWCWAAVARMFAKSLYENVSYTQADIVKHIKGSTDNLDGTNQDIIDAIHQYISNVATSGLGLGEQVYRIYSESTLIKYLDDGFVVAIGRGWYPDINNPNDMRGAHETLVVGYVRADDKVRFIIYDPLPEKKGSMYLSSHEKLVNGRNIQIGDESSDTGVWIACVAITFSYFDETEPCYFLR